MPDFSAGGSSTPTSGLRAGEDPIMDIPGGPGAVQVKYEYTFDANTMRVYRNSDSEYVGTYAELVNRHRSGQFPPTGGPGAPLAGGAGGSAGAAVTSAIASMQPQITGGGRGFSIGAGLTQEVHAQRPGEFAGVNTEGPDTMISPLETPYAVNFNDIDRLGSLSVRRGLCKLKEDIDSLVYPNGGSALASTYQGSSITVIPTNAPDSTSPGLLMTFSDASGVIGATANQRCILARQIPLWARERDLEGVARWGTVTLTGGSGSLSFDLTWGTTDTLDDVIAISARYSTESYPLDLDGRDDRSSAPFNNGDRYDWTGVNVVKTKTGLTAGTYYCTAWAIGRYGISAPIRRKATVT